MKSFKEAIDDGGVPGLFHPTKRAKYATKLDVEKVFPDLGPEAQRYLEMVTSDSYKKTIERLEHYTGKDPKTLNLNSMMRIAMTAIMKVTTIQQGHEKELEKLAVDVVLNLPEFKLFKQLVANGDIKLIAKLDSPDLSNAATSLGDEEPEEPIDENELAPEEEVEMALAEELSQVDDSVLKRKFANMITQGNAVNKLYLFQLASESLDKINPDLVKLYGILSVVVQSLYYITPDMPFSDAIKGAAVGSEEIVPEEDGTYTITARSPFLPYVIHELVKGMYDYLSMDVTSQSNLDDETIDDETVDIMSGPQLYTNLAKLVTGNDTELLPLVYKLLLKEDIATIKSVLEGGGKAQRIIAGLISQARNLMDAFNKEDEYSDSDYQPDPQEDEEDLR